MNRKKEKKKIKKGIVTWLIIRYSFAADFPKWIVRMVNNYNRVFLCVVCNVSLSAFPRFDSSFIQKTQTRVLHDEPIENTHSLSFCSLSKEFLILLCSSLGMIRPRQFTSMICSHIYFFFLAKYNLRRSTVMPLL